MEMLNLNLRLVKLKISFFSPACKEYPVPLDETVMHEQIISIQYSKSHGPHRGTEPPLVLQRKHPEGRRIARAEYWRITDTCPDKGRVGSVF